jgi:uncharacterized Ntn-hydrolase superfamily protein
MTYSIVARDPDTGELGVAVQSCWFGVGPIVPWARAGVGAVATQSFAELAYGPRCLDLMAAGSRATAALDQVVAGDEGSALRQVGVVDATGSVGAHTGAMCLDHAGHHEGDGYAVQANMMATDRVWPAMAEAYEATSGAALPERLLAALRAAQREGGDARGQMSAAMVVVDGERRDEPWVGVTLDVRVEEHESPLDELARLLDLAVDYGTLDAAEEALTEGRGEEALALLAPVLDRRPREGNVLLIQAGALAAVGQPEHAVEVVRTLLGVEPTWAVVLRSFVDKGMVQLPPGVDIDTLAPS